MTELDWAYLAGLIDGDGSIGLSHTVQVRFFNTDLEIIGWLLEKFPDAKLHKANSNSSYGHQLCLTVRWNGVKAKPILEGIYPYLRGKKKELAELALELIRILETNYRYMTPEIKESKRVLVETAAILNSKKG